MRLKLVCGVLWCILFTGCQKESITSAGIADDHFFLKSGNLEMPVAVHGNVESKKFILIIHGGPGGNGSDYRDSYAINLVEKKMAVVYWDQRFAGNSQGNGGVSDVSAFRKDIKQLIFLLRHLYGASAQVYIMGHSWGGFLTPYFLVEGNNQTMVQGWIQVDGAHNYRMNDSLTREMLLTVGKEEVAAGRNTATWQEIVDWCLANGFEGDENTGQLNSYAHKAEELIADISIPKGTEESIQNSSVYFSNWINERASGRLRVDGPAYTISNSDQLYKLQLPTLLLWGAYDFVCPPLLAMDIEQRVSSKDVQKIIYAQSGHSPMVNEPVKFWEDVLDWVGKH